MVNTWLQIELNFLLCFARLPCLYLFDLDSGFDWDAVYLSPEDIESMQTFPAGRQLLTLIQGAE